MTDAEVEMALELSACTFLPGSYPKRFARSLYGQARNGKQITDAQALRLRILHHQYRRQITSHKCSQYCPPTNAKKLPGQLL